MSSDGEGNKLQLAPTWLNEEFFLELLQRDFPNFKAIKDFRIAPAVDAGENFLTILLRVTIELELTANPTKMMASFVAKVPPPIAEVTQMVKEMRIFPKERNTYLQYVPQFEALYRKAGEQLCFAAKIYEPQQPPPGIDKDYLILQDLKVAGFKNVNRLEGLDMAHTQAVLSKLAKFHAASVIWHARNGPYPAMYNSCMYAEEDKFVQFRANIAASICDNLALYKAEYMRDQLLHYTKDLADQYQLPADYSFDEFRVLNHGDAWSNNIMFQHDAAGNIMETYFVDLQMSRWCSPAQDLIYLLLTSTSLAIKLTHFDYFVRYYHEQLVECLRLLGYQRALPTLKDLHVAIYRHADWVYTACIFILPIVLLDPSKEANLKNLVDDNQAGRDLRRALQQNPRFVTHIQQILPWAYNRGFFEKSRDKMYV